MDQNKIQQMQFLEQNLQSLMMQKQAFQMELNETISALKEIENAEDEVYRIIGQLMIKTSKEKIKEDLMSKRKLIEIRLNSLEKQEGSLSEQAEKLREEVLGSIKKSD